jgi:hypothetical protein
MELSVLPYCIPIPNVEPVKPLVDFFAASSGEEATSGAGEGENVWRAGAGGVPGTKGELESFGTISAASFWLQPPKEAMLLVLLSSASISFMILLNSLPGIKSDFTPGMLAELTKLDSRLRTLSSRMDTRPCG